MRAQPCKLQLTGIGQCWAPDQTPAHSQLRQQRLQEPAGAGGGPGGERRLCPLWALADLLAAPARIKARPRLALTAQLSSARLGSAQLSSACSAHRCKACCTRLQHICGPPVRQDCPPWALHEALVLQRRWRAAVCMLQGRHHVCAVARRVGPSHQMALRETLVVPMRTDAGLPDFLVKPNELDQGSARSWQRGDRFRMRFGNKNLRSGGRLPHHRSCSIVLAGAPTAWAEPQPGSQVKRQAASDCAPAEESVQLAGQKPALHRQL